VVVIFVAEILTYEPQKVVAGGPIFLRTLRHPVTFEQSMARLSRYAAAVGSGQAVTSPLTAATRRNLDTVMILRFEMEVKRVDDSRSHVEDATFLIHSPAQL
jgi:hypothetical protein